KATVTYKPYIQPKLTEECQVKNDHDSGAPGASAEGSSLLQLEPLKAAKKRCQGVTKNGAACTAWAMEGGLCYFHANPDKAAQLGRNGGRRRQHSYEQSMEHIAVPESAADVRRILAETMAEVKAGRMDPKVANTLTYVATSFLVASHGLSRREQRSSLLQLELFRLKGQTLEPANACFSPNQFARPSFVPSAWMRTGTGVWLPAGTSEATTS